MTAETVTALRLSAAQLEAAGVLEGAVRVVAGPGAGKTAVIAERFGRLVEAGVEPSSILVTTFTERAAAEMADRIRARTGADTADAVGTFHSHALRWLREDGAAAGVRPGFSVLAGADRWIAMRELLWETGTDALLQEERPDEIVGALLGLHEKLRQELASPARLGRWAQARPSDPRAPLLAAAAGLFERYEAWCAAENRFDFDELIVRAVRMLESDAGLRARYARRYRYVMVDEYQDTNLAQERLVELVGAHGNVFAVGDDDQSIYRFRGASRASMERFMSSFPNVRQIELATNWRSAAPIVEAATALIASNPDRIPKRLAAERGDGAPVEIRESATGSGELAWIAGEALALGEVLALDRVAVLVRTREIGAQVAAGLRASGVRVQLWAGGGFYSRPEIRDVIAYLRVLGDPGDRLSLARLLRKEEAGVDLSEVAPIVGDAEDPLVALAETAAAPWAGTLSSLRRLVASTGVSDLFFELMASTGYAERLAPPEVEAVGRFGEIVAEFAERAGDQSLREFLARLDLVLLSGVEDDGRRPERVPDAVQVMTIHQAKGLEFDAVFLPSLVEGRLPQPSRGALQLPPEVVEADPLVRGREDHLAEERRLAYVALTRARDLVRVSYAGAYDGGRRWRPSRFIDEMLAAPGGAVRRPEPRPEPAPPGAAGTAPEPVARARRRRPSAVESHSFTALSTYRECPRRYWFRYVARLPAPEPVEAIAGTAAHAALQEVSEAAAAGVAVTAATLRDALRRAWPEIAGLESRRGERLREVVGGRLETFRQTGRLDTPAWGVEVPFSTPMDGWELRGVIDRIEEPAVEGAAWRVVDYKTGRPLPASRLRRDFQVALYAIGARALGVEPAELEVIHLRDGSSSLVPATDDILLDAAAEASKVVAGIRAGDFEPHPDRRRCHGCRYRLACLAAAA